jgi:putative transposase
LKSCSSSAILHKSSSTSDKEQGLRAKATTTIRQVLTYRPSHGAWFAATQALFNQVAAFYFEVALANVSILALSDREALTALERLTHATEKNPHPVMPLSAIAEDIPAMFRRAAIHAALGSARSFHTHLSKWRKRKEQALTRGKKFTERPPVPPRSWNKSATLYAGMWKERTASSIMLKVWTGTCWSWIKVRITGRELPAAVKVGSPSLIRRGNRWWLHTPLEKHFRSPPTIEQQVTTNAHTKICAVDLNLNEHLAVCTIQTVEGTILATRFIGGGRRIAGFRKQQLGRIARNRRKTGVIAIGEQDNIDLWRKITHADEDISHLVSARIVQFAKAHGATIVVFEHLGNLKPARGTYSRRGNSKRAYWMKGRIFQYAKYKAYHEGMLTSRVNPRNTSRACAHCGAQVVRYAQGKEAEGYTPGAPLVRCPECGMRSHADRNASLRIGQRLIARYQSQEKPHAPLPPRETERELKDSGVVGSQDAKSFEQPSIALASRHGNSNGHGTAHKGKRRRMGTPSLSIPPQLRLPRE